MVESVDDLKSSRSIQGCTYFMIFEMLDAMIASALNKIIQNSPLQKEGQSGVTESSERGSVSSRKTDRLHDLRLLSCTGAHDTVVDYADLISITLRNDNVQDFDTK